MSEPYVGQIILFGGNYVPDNWHLCDGAELRVSDYQVLFSLLGTNYGGDGMTTFGIPDLRGRAPVALGQATPEGIQNWTPGTKVGTETVTLAVGELPPHNHPMNASSVVASDVNPVGNIFATDTDNSFSDDLSKGVQKLLPAIVSNWGGSASHNNMATSIAMNYIIALNGFYPQQS